MPTVASLIERLRVNAGDRPTYDSLNGALIVSATAITFTDGSEITEQSLIDVDFEVMVVTDKSSTTAGTVLRGQYGTTPLAQVDGETVLTGFRFSRHAYLQGLNEALQAITHGFGKPSWNTTSTFSSTTRMLEVPANALPGRGLGVFHEPSSITQLKPVPTSRPQSVPTSIFPSGKAVHLLSWTPSSGTAYIGYEAPWPQLPEDNTASLDADFPIEAEDLLILGATASLMEPQMFKRVAYDQPHTRQEAFAVTESSVRVTEQTLTQQFILKRSEVAATRHMTNYAWLKG